MESASLCESPSSRSPSTSDTRLSSFDLPPTIDWGWALSHDPVDLIELAGSGRAKYWLESILQGLAVRCKDSPAPPAPREVEPQWLPDDLVPLVGAHDERRGALAVLRIKDSSECLSDPDPMLAGDGPAVAATAGIRIACAPFAELMPESPRPMVELDVRHAAAGDSVALPAAMAALLRLFGCTWPDDLVATGGIDVLAGEFLSVPRSTLIGKARAARAWGYRRLAVIDIDGSLPDRIEGLKVCPLPSDPARLGLALVALSGVEPGEAVLARALTVFDQRVGIRGPKALKNILESTEPFITSDSAIVSHVAHDMRSRAYLHAGRSEDAERELHLADDLLGIGWHPEGRLRDVLRYQRAAHRAVVHLDLGHWADDHPVHKNVDALIDSLDGLWATKHERLMRIFLANTRARRHEYLGRLHGEASRLELAWDDLVADHDDWDELLEVFARDELRRLDTDRARIENQLTDVAYSRFQLEGSLPVSWTERMMSIGSAGEGMSDFVTTSGTAAFRCELKDGRVLFLGGHPFNAIAFLKRGLMMSTDERPPELAALLTAVKITPTCALDYPWFHWFELLVRAAHGGGHRSALALDPRERDLIWRFVFSGSQGIATLIALRSHSFLVGFGVDSPPPEAPGSSGPLHVLFEDLRSRPEDLFLRAPY